MQVKNNDLVIATHGRGFWIMDNVTPLRQITSQITAAPAHLFEIALTHHYLPVQSMSRKRSFHPGVGYSRSGSEFIVGYEDRKEPNSLVKRVYLNAGENPREGVMIDYYLKEAGEASLAILDAKGEEIRRFSTKEEDSLWMSGDAGVNRFVWNMRYPNARELPPDGPLTGAEYSRAQAPTAPPGRYRARLSVGGQDYEQPFEIVKDPRVRASDSDLEAQFTLMMQIRDRITEVTDAVERLREARRQLEERKSDGDPAVAEIEAKLQAIEGQLTRAVGPKPTFNLPSIGLNNRLAVLTGAVGDANARPTQQAYAVFEELSDRVTEQLPLLDETLAQVEGGAAEGAPAPTAGQR